METFLDIIWAAVVIIFFCLVGITIKDELNDK